MKACKKCQQIRPNEKLQIRLIGRYKKYEALFCSDSDCYIQYMHANERTNEISRRQFNQRARAGKKTAIKPFSRTMNLFS